MERISRAIDQSKGKAKRTSQSRDASWFRLAPHSFEYFPEMHHFSVTMWQFYRCSGLLLLDALHKKKKRKRRSKEKENKLIATVNDRREEKQCLPYCTLQCQLSINPNCRQMSFDECFSFRLLFILSLLQCKLIKKMKSFLKNCFDFLSILSDGKLKRNVKNALIKMYRSKDWKECNLKNGKKLIHSKWNSIGNF